MEIQSNNRWAEKVQPILAEAFQIPTSEVTPELAFGDLPQWDSMGHMELMILLEERFGIEINADTIAELVSLPAICEHLSRREA